MDNYITKFKNYPFETRIKKAKEFLLKFKNKVPVIINYNYEVDEKLSKETLEQRHKFLLSDEMTLSEFLKLFKSKYKIDQSEGIFCFIKDTIPRLNSTMKELYAQYKDDDYFLYIDIKKESTFG
jgi:hypothetical protein